MLVRDRVSELVDERIGACVGPSEGGRVSACRSPVAYSRPAFTGLQSVL